MKETSVIITKSFLLIFTREEEKLVSILASTWLFLPVKIYKSVLFIEELLAYFYHWERKHK
jgi:hypothetical protein